MVGLSDVGLYQRALLTFNGHWTNNMEADFDAARNLRRNLANHGAPRAVKTEPQITVALDLGAGIWVCRGTNWQLARSSFIGVVSGNARKDGTDIILEAPRANIFIQGYFSNDSPAPEGRAFHGERDEKARFRQYTHWWRYADPSIMSPIDRMAEMLDRAVRNGKLKARLREQFGGLVPAEILLPLAGTFLALFGAELVGGVRAVRAVGVLMGVNQVWCDSYFYEPRVKEIYRVCNYAATVRDLEQGADTLAEILCQMISDIAMAVGITALSRIASRLFNALIVAAPESVRLALRDVANASRAYIAGKPYARMDLLLDAAGTPLEPAAIKMYKEASERNREVLVVREPDAQRLAWVTGEMPNRAKSCMIKAKSGDGLHGLVCLKRADVTGSLKPAGTYSLEKLRGYNKGFDAESLPASLPCYEMPMDGRKMGPGIDYDYTGKNHSELAGHRLVDLGDRYLIIDAQGRPYIADLDLATRNRPGLSKAGAHLPGKGEDSPVLEAKLNEAYHRYGGNSSHYPAQHSGRAATVGYNEANIGAGKIPGLDFWGPQDNTKSGFKTERLVVFLPEAVHGTIRSKMYVFRGWSDFKIFFESNGMQFGFKNYAEVQAMRHAAGR